jgi:small-conductance mechanosensitive channel
MAFVLILALEQLGIETTLLTTVAAVLITATALALALAFGLGSRELAHNIMAGFHAKETFSVGQQVDVRGHIGRLASIGPVKTVIETDNGMVSLPNSTLTDDVVTVILPGEGS